MDINPRRISGSWKDGYSLDQQTRGSIFLGYNEFGHPQFDTTRTAMGDLMYKVKFRGDRSLVAEIAKTVSDFVRQQGWPVELVVPVPPSNLNRPYQPVWLIGTAVADLLGVQYCQACLIKTRETPQLKNTSDPDERARVLFGALQASASVRSKSVLLFDDLVSSATSLNEAARVLTAGDAASIYVLTLTRARTRR